MCVCVCVREGGGSFVFASCFSWSLPLSNWYPRGPRPLLGVWWPECTSQQVEGAHVRTWCGGLDGQAMYAIPL